MAALLLSATPALSEEGSAPGAQPAIDPALVANPAGSIQQKVEPNTLTSGADPTFTTGLFSSSRATLLGDAFGIRTLLGRYGISVSASEVSEVFGNATGGVQQGAAYDGLTTATLQLDTLRAFGIVGGLFNVSALQIHGRNLSAKNLDVLQTVSGIEANRATRLWELWYDQAFNNGAFDIKLGQQSLDQEFITSTGLGALRQHDDGVALDPFRRSLRGRPRLPLVVVGCPHQG